MESPLPLPRLYIFPISHYCEKARWALDYLNVDYLADEDAQFVRGAWEFIAAAMLEAICRNRPGCCRQD